MKKRLLVIDANALVHRAYHALPPLKTKKGELVNAVYGFLSVFLKTIKELKPDYVAACFDMPGPTFRHKEYKEYKATRPKAPDELYEQIPKIKSFLDVFNVPIFEKQGFEADDILATIAESMSGTNGTSTQQGKDKLRPGEEIETIILTGDMDILQLVGKNTKVFALRKGIKDMVLYDSAKVQEKYGLSPAQISDMKGLMGDASDNIPGVPGIGPKTASQLLQNFDTLEGVYKDGLAEPARHNKTYKTNRTNTLAEEAGKRRAGQASPSGGASLRRESAISPRIKELLLKYKEQVFLSRMLATLRYDVPVRFQLQDCLWKDFNKEKAAQMLKDFEFYSLIQRLPGEQREQRALF